MGFYVCLLLIICAIIGSNAIFLIRLFKSVDQIRSRIIFKFIFKFIYQLSSMPASLPPFAISKSSGTRCPVVR
jgi:hypothetical protein